MGGNIRVLLLVALMFAVATAGCAIPGTSPERDSGVLGPIWPTPTVTPTPPSPTPAPLSTPAVTPVPTVASPGTIATPAGENYSHTYSWEYKNVDWAFTAVVQKAKYDLFKAKPHSTDMSFSSYAMASEDRDLIGSAAQQIRRGGAGYGFTRYDDAMNLITFVQSIPYVDDHPTGSPRYPLETLADVQGDCKDKAVLAAALLQAAGFDVALLKFPELRHVAVGISVDASGTSYLHGSTRYFYVETTSPGWAIGEVPGELKTAAPTIIPVVSNPGLQITVAATAAGRAANLVDYRVQYTIANRGPGTANQVVLKLRAMALRQGDNVIWAPERTVELGDLAEGQVISADMLMMVPAGEPSRIVGIASGENADPVQACTPDFVAGN